MTYTLAMAADQGIQIADDGVAEVSMTEARANLTQLIREVRYGGRAGAFTERGQRSAYVVPPDWYERARTALGES
jgi:prevent-host-death family protein